MESLKIFDIPIHNVDMGEALKETEGMLLNAKQNKIFTINPEISLLALKDKRYRKVLQSADMALPDGIGLVLFGWLIGSSFKKRVAGADFMIKLVKLAERMGKSIFLLGGENRTGEKTAYILKQMFPKIEIAGWLENTDDLEVEYTKNSSSRNASSLLSKSDILFVALGAPKQEMWISENITKFPNIKVAMSVGGSFDFISGKIKRAPKFMQSIGLEWSWRLFMEPRKRFRRIFNAVVIFPIQVIKSRIMDKEFRNS